MKNILTRRTICSYTKENVDDTLLNELLFKASRTQTMGNLQIYSVVVTRSEEMKQRLAPAHFNQPMVTTAPVVLTFCADFRRTTRWAEERQASPGYDNFLSYQNAATDALLYCQTFCNLAEEEGLGLCFLGTTVYMPQLIIDTLQLPRLVFPVATITVGWPAEDPPLTDRLPLAAIRHDETYCDYTPERIDAFYTAPRSSCQITRSSYTSMASRRLHRCLPTAATRAATTRLYLRLLPKPYDIKVFFPRNPNCMTIKNVQKL